MLSTKSEQQKECLDKILTALSNPTDVSETYGNISSTATTSPTVLAYDHVVQYLGLRDMLDRIPGNQEQKEIIDGNNCTFAERFSTFQCS